jgi:hypothetical protein
VAEVRAFGVKVISSDLLLELQKRNARLRAWRAYGVPIEGGWEPLKFLGHHVLTLRCGDCGRGDWFARPPDATRHQVRRAEVILLDKLSDPKGDGSYTGCPHLAPLLGDDPPEVQAIAELELLAGEGGHHG